MIEKTSLCERGENFPSWIRPRLRKSKKSPQIKKLLERFSLKTVCQYAVCPNCSECWDKGHLTVMILGSICTRKCAFCNIRALRPSDPDEKEPGNVSSLARELFLKYLVVTSVTRDDLCDSGAGHFCEVARLLKKNSPGLILELLVPDFSGDERLIKKVASSGAEVLSHNIEMPRELYPEIRPDSDYQTSIKVLTEFSKRKHFQEKIAIKSSMMLGLGETREMIKNCFADLREAGVDILYLGQYLAPTKQHFPVQKYYLPEDFKKIRDLALNFNFKVVHAGPLVRSSYRSGEAYEEFLHS